MPPAKLSSADLVTHGRARAEDPKQEVASLQAIVARSRAAEAAWMAEREAMRAELEAARAGRAEAEAMAEGAEARYARAMREGTERQVAERMALLEERSASLRVRSEALQEERDAARSEAEGLRAELDMVSGLRRREKSEATARLASLEDHVVKMHAASWSLQKTKLLQLQKTETALDQLRARLLRKTMMHMRSRLLLPCWHAWNDLAQKAKIARAQQQEEEERSRRGSIYSTRSLNLSLLDNFTTFN